MDLPLDARCYHINVVCTESFQVTYTRCGCADAIICISITLMLLLIKNTYAFGNQRSIRELEHLAALVLQQDVPP